MKMYLCFHTLIIQKKFDKSHNLVKINIFFQFFNRAHDFMSKMSKFLIFF
jgi:hypothetical protein